MENQSLRGVGAAEQIWWKIKALEWWAPWSEYGGKSKLPRVRAPGPIWGKFKTFEGLVQRSQYGGKSKP